MKKKKLRLRNWVVVVLFYLLIALLTYLVSLRIEYLISLGY